MSLVEHEPVSLAAVEVRVLGNLRVRRGDGSVVEPAEWLTSQTTDLLRLLALRVDEPVAVDLLVDALWPNVDEKRGRASLRTAASRIRKVIGTDCVQRRFGGLMLTGAWVDADQFRTLALQARRHVLRGEFAEAVAITRAADAIYLGEFCVPRTCADWVQRESDALAASYRTMIADAADAAAELAWWHDAVELAERTLVVEPCSERAYRTLMRANRGLGETAVALKTYDRCRQVLAEEVGADPCKQTQELHLELLADPPSIPVTEPSGPRLVELAPTGARLSGATAESRAEFLLTAMRAADVDGDEAARVLTRLALVREVGIPQRKFKSVRRWCRQALALTQEPALCAEVLVTGWLVGAVLSDSAAAEQGFARSAAMLAEADPGRSVRSLLAVQTLVAHDLGRRTYPKLRKEASRYGVFDELGHAGWVAIRIATERGDFAAASLADTVATPTGAPAVVWALRGCASAALAMELGRSDVAHRLLTGVLDLAAETGCTLAVPEAAARLVMLDAVVDPVAARRRFEQFDESVGDVVWFPREKVLKLLARAAVRGADNRPDDAASAAAAAACEAERAGLVFLAAYAHRHRAVHLAAAGRSYDSRLAIAAATRWQQAADTTVATRHQSTPLQAVAADPRGPRGLRV